MNNNVQTTRYTDTKLISIFSTVFNFSLQRLIYYFPVYNFHLQKVVRQDENEPHGIILKSVSFFYI